MLASGSVILSFIITQHRSVAKNVGCFWQRLFVCLFVNTIISECVNIGWWNLGLDGSNKDLGEVQILGLSPAPRLDAQLPKMWHFAESRRMTQNVNKCKQSHVGRETSHGTQCARKTGVWLPCWENQRRLSSLDVSPTWLILMYSLLFNVFICAFRQCCELKIGQCRKFIVSRRVCTVLPLR